MSWKTLEMDDDWYPPENDETDTSNYLQSQGLYTKNMEDLGVRSPRLVHPVGTGSSPVQSMTKS